MLVVISPAKRLDEHPARTTGGTEPRFPEATAELVETARDLGAAFPARCAFDLAYAASFFQPDERAAFLQAAGNPHAVDAARARLRPLAPLFAVERYRQRRAA